MWHASCRERFSGAGENGARSPIGEMLDNNDDDKNQLDTDPHTHATNTKDNDNDNDKDSNNQKVVGINPIPEHFNEEEIEEPAQEPAQEPELEQEQEVDPPSSEGRWQDRPNLNLDSQDSINGWEAEDHSEAAEESYDENYLGTSYDWFADISRPRSYWEDRRKSWYQQMLDSNSANEEIRQLIERCTVPFLYSFDASSSYVLS